jgi:hypothetical protein
VKNDYGTEYEAWALNGLEEPLKKWRDKRKQNIEKIIS